ncbi:DUF2796 domain-containing protein [Ruegeria sp. HKCCD4884]|uniref:ZrgA family zinc uptake protein n=1 Tax=Ruegeria sp. HKCCD4884 TaxID=2683022 RepID=UPI00149247A9|nr:DUF2796 domain-containing protein [Ruegeria sp. HKCCD4884]NOD93407.1 DUF2796 domain-containing protein [Ruegeria sp. HKCCD4884]
MKCAVLAMFLFPAALAAQATQVTTPHQHGTGQLDVVLTETGFSLKLSVPSVDIVGFEAPVSNDDERTQVAIAISELSEPLDLFVVPEEAGCFTASANVILTHDIADQVDVASGKSASEGHAEFQADYVVQCQDMSLLDRIDFAYFEKFSGTEKLSVRVEAGGVTQTHQATRVNRSITLP